MFDAAIPLLYMWTFQPGGDSDSHARAICSIADSLYQLGRGADMAWATGDIADDAGVALRDHGGVVRRPNQIGAGATLPCPGPGSLASLVRRFNAMRGRFTTVGEGKKARVLFAQAPKPQFRQVPYNSPSKLFVFEIRNESGFAPQPLAGAAALTERIRDLAVQKLKASAWRPDDPKREALADRVFIGRDAQEADKAQRIQITPVPSIGHVHTEHSIRRVLIIVPPDCPIARGDVEWAFSGLTLADAETGEVTQDTAQLVVASDDTMLEHYGFENAARFWRTVTPAVLPQRAVRRRIAPHRITEEAKGGAERLREHESAEWAVRQALRHAGVDIPLETIRVQRDPFESKGLRAEAFAAGTRFAKERFWHVEIGLSRAQVGPLLIGDGRFLGLGLMRPIPRTEGIFAFTILTGLACEAEPPALTRALRRAVMARVQEAMGGRIALPAFFSGHAANGAPARSGRHEHIAFVYDATGKRLLIIAPHMLERREAFRQERDYLQILDKALEALTTLRAGGAGILELRREMIDPDRDALLAPAREWTSQTSYRVTRHAKHGAASAALEADLLVECRRAGCPRPQVETIETAARPRLGLHGLARLRFNSAVQGPILLGRDRHFGGGLFIGSR